MIGFSIMRICFESPRPLDTCSPISRKSLNSPALESSPASPSSAVATPKLMIMPAKRAAPAWPSMSSTLSLDVTATVKLSMNRLPIFSARAMCASKLSSPGKSPTSNEPPSSSFSTSPDTRGITGSSACRNASMYSSPALARSGKMFLDSHSTTSPSAPPANVAAAKPAANRYANP